MHYCDEMACAPPGSLVSQGDLVHYCDDMVGPVRWQSKGSIIAGCAVPCMGRLERVNRCRPVHGSVGCGGPAALGGVLRQRSSPFWAVFSQGAMGVDNHYENEKNPKG